MVRIAAVTGRTLVRQERADLPLKVDLVSVNSEDSSAGSQARDSLNGEAQQRRKMHGNGAKNRRKAGQRFSGEHLLVSLVKRAAARRFAAASR
jgi:hypothetical protein